MKAADVASRTRPNQTERTARQRVQAVGGCRGVDELTERIRQRTGAGIIPGIHRGQILATGGYNPESSGRDRSGIVSGVGAVVILEIQADGAGMAHAEHERGR